MKSPDPNQGFSLTWMTTIGGVGQTVFANWLPLRYVVGAIYNMSTSLAQNPIHVASASPMRCKSVPVIRGSTSRKRIKVAVRIGQHRELTDSQIGTCWKRAPLVQHTVDTMLERAVTMNQNREIRWTV